MQQLLRVRKAFSVLSIIGISCSTFTPYYVLRYTHPLRYNYASFSPCSTATLPIVIRADTKKGRHRFQRHRLQQQLNRRPAGGLS